MSSAGDPASSFGRYQSWAATHCGTVRAHNEDAYVNRPDLGLWAVADGAGGHQSGDVAANAVAAALLDIPAGLPAQDLLSEIRERLDQAHLRLRDQAEASGPGVIMATTVVVLLAQDDHFACLWAGDSRAYLLRHGTLTRISRDHSLVEDLLDAGAVTVDEVEGHPQANIITRAVGAGLEGLTLEKRTGALLPGDRLLLCSDGLTKTLDDGLLAYLLAAGPDDGEDGRTDEAGMAGVGEGSAGAAADGAARLVRAALEARATDNVTALVVQVGGPDDGNVALSDIVV